MRHFEFRPARIADKGMKKDPIDKWIDRYLADHPPGSKSVVITIFGDAIIPHGGRVWLGSLIELLKPFHIDDRLARTSVFRLAEEGWFDTRREGRRSIYTLTQFGEKRFERAYERIYFPTSQPWNRKWTLVIMPPPLISPSHRASLKKELLWEGFSLVSPGIFAHPTVSSRVLDDMLHRVGAAGKVFVCITKESEKVPTLPLSKLVSPSWDLEPVSNGYRKFIAQFSALAEQLQSATEFSPQQAFILRTILMHAFRRLQLNDPQLPPELLPPDWPAQAAYVVCRDIYKMTYQPAELHITTILKQEDPELGAAVPSFYKRFGGLE